MAEEPIPQMVQSTISLDLDAEPDITKAEMPMEPMPLSRAVDKVVIEQREHYKVVVLGTEEGKYSYYFFPPNAARLENASLRLHFQARLGGIQPEKYGITFLGVYLLSYTQAQTAIRLLKGETLE